MEEYYWYGYILPVPILCYYSYYYAKSLLDRYIIRQVTKKLDEIGNVEDIKFQPLRHTRSAVVVFEHGGRTHKVCVPFDNSKARNMRRKRVYLIRKNEEGDDIIEITHKPGVPYLMCADEMGGDSIVVKKDNKVVRVYSSLEKPIYLEPSSSD